MLKKMVKGPIIGICGGVGPLAGTFYQKLIILNTIANKDPDHLSVVHVCDPSDVCDRTAYLQGLADPKLPQLRNPGEVMGQISVSITQYAHFVNRSAIICVPCNTFHSPPIFSVYEKTIMDYCKANGREEGPGSAQIVHLIDSTVEYVKAKGYTTIGLTSTSGTREQGIYKKPFEAVGIKVVEVDDQEAIHQSIYNEEYGVKALSAVCPKSRGIMEAAIKELKGKGAQGVILGCTELPIAIPEAKLFDIDMIDPMEVMCRKAISLADPTKLKPKL